ncbi:unnamed protein product, partial [Rotaria magnacalcarata]
MAKKTIEYPVCYGDIIDPYLDTVKYECQHFSSV